MTSKFDYKNMSDDELERLAPEDSEAAWELFNRLLDQGEPLEDMESNDTQPLPSPTVVDG